MSVKDNFLIEALSGLNKDDAELDLLFTNKEVLLTGMEVLMTADTNSDEEVENKMDQVFDGGSTTEDVCTFAKMKEI